VDTEGLVTALCAFSRALCESDREYARTTAVQGYKYALNILHEGPADKALSEVAEALFRAGDVEKSKEALERIADEDLRKKARQIAEKPESTIATEKAEDDDESPGNAEGLKDLIESAAAAKSDADACFQLMGAVRLAVQLGDESKAAALARQVFSKIDKLDNERSKIEPLIQLIGVYCDVAPEDLAKRALMLTDSITDRDYKLSVLSVITPKLVDHFGSRAFLELVDPIHDGPALVAALDAATEELVANGRSAEALPLWRRSLSLHRNLGRGRMNSMLERGAPVLFSIDQGETLRKVCEDIFQVERWWEEQA
jgi:tetratricopeptide (TPR) repeat protein